MKRTQLARLVVGYTRRELPAWGRLLALVGGLNQELWETAPRATMRGKWHGLTVSLDMSNWAERLNYFIGRSFEIDTELVLRSALTRGDSFVDAGANFGALTLLAAGQVGETGSVYAFEPNPDIFARLQAHVDDNGLGAYVKVHQCGLGDRRQDLVLNVNTETSGGRRATFARPTPDEQALFAQTHTVPVYPADDLLPEQLPGLSLIKIDVEGFEIYVIRGLERTIANHRPIVLTEVEAGHLERAGTSVAELFELLEGRHGYRGYNIEVRSRAWHHQMSLQPVNDAAPKSRNLVWLAPESAGYARLAPWMVSK